MFIYTKGPPFTSALLSGSRAPTEVIMTTLLELH